MTDTRTDPKSPTLKQIAGFELIEKIGQGGMGSVFKARQVSLDRIVALKVLPPSIAKDAQFIERFMREARAAGRLNHPHIVQGIDAGCCAETHLYYFAMEFVDGQTLGQQLEESGAFSEEFVRQIARQMGEALEYANQNGLVHRDIKPDNILLNSQGMAKLADLGLAKQTAQEDARLTQAGVALGTPLYMSPEQVRGQIDQIDTRTDLYCLGATLFHLVTGQVPYQGATNAVVMCAHLTEKVPLAHQVNSEVSEGFSRLLQALMQKEKTRRPLDPKAFLERLERLDAVSDTAKRAGRGLSLTTGPRDLIRSTTTRTRDRIRPGSGLRKRIGEEDAGPKVAEKFPRSFYLIGGLLVILLLGGGLLAFSFSSKDELPKVALKQGAPESATSLDPVLVTATSPKPSWNAAEELEIARKAMARNPDDLRGAILLYERLLQDAQREKAEAQWIQKIVTERDAARARVREAAEKLETEKRRLEAEKRRQAEVARLATAAGAGTSTEGAGGRPVSTSDRPPVPVVSRQESALRLFSAVEKETAPLLTENRFADAQELLERKAKDPALADAAELLKQEQTDIGAVVELRKTAIEALRRKVGEEVSLKVGNSVNKGKVIAAPEPDVIALDVGGPVIALRAEKVQVDDIERNAPRTANEGEDLRRRGLLYLYAGRIAKAKEYFTKAGTAGFRSAGAGAGRTPAFQEYMDRIAALELGEVESRALRAWENAEKLFAARDLKGAKEAYDSFAKAHGETKTAAAKADALKERYAAIEKVFGPPPTLTVDLAPGVKMEFVLVKAGEFEMGSKDGAAEEQPVHKVKISKSYYIARCETTVAQFRAFADTSKYLTEAEKGNRGWGWKNGHWGDAEGLNWRTPGFEQTPDHPATVITWNDAQEFCKWAAKQTGRTVHLPSEAQWEYAARGPENRKYPWGNKDDWTLLNHADAAMKSAGIAQQFGSSSTNDGFAYTSPVGSYKNGASWCGAFDMAGNVWEWVEDRFDGGYYANSPALDPPGPTTGKDHLLRGGGWFNGPGGSTCRLRNNPGLRNAVCGFRCALDL